MAGGDCRARTRVASPIGVSAPISGSMSKKPLNAEERALQAQQKRFESDKAIAEYRAREEAINKNTERLRALRLARDAQNPPPPPTGKVSKAKKQSKATLTDYLKREADSGRKT